MTPTARVQLHQLRQRAAAGFELQFAGAHAHEDALGLGPRSLGAAFAFVVAGLALAAQAKGKVRPPGIVVLAAPMRCRHLTTKDCRNFLQVAMFIQEGMSQSYDYKELFRIGARLANGLHMTASQGSKPLGRVWVAAPSCYFEQSWRMEMKRLARISFAVVLSVFGIVQAGATVVTIAPTNVNRIIDCCSLNSTVFTDYFSTYNVSGNIQQSLVFTAGSTFDAALIGALGSGYVINSVALVVGDVSDDYSLAASARSLNAAYNPATVTWASFVSGSIGALEATGVVSGDTTSFDLTTIVSSWISGGTNFGLHFASAPNNTSDSFTASRYVQWVVDASPAPATRVPEPGSIALVGLAIVGLGLSRRRRMR